MGNGSSRNPSQQLPGQKSQGFFSPTQQVNPGMGLPPTQPSKIYDFQFIIKRPPLPIPQSTQETAKNNSQNSEKKLEQITGILLNYNREKWKFGNKDDGQPRPLFNENTYKLFLDFVTNLINGRNQNANANANSKDKKDIVREIHKLLNVGANQLVNKFFKVEILKIFPDIPGVKQDDTIWVTLLGLASIIGAEHIIIYLLMCGADPSLTFESDNKDSATLLLAYQIAFCKILQSNQSLQILKYSIVLSRILCILLLLGSIGQGVDLSAIFQTNEVKNKVNLSGSQKGVIVKSSILNMLSQMPGRSIPNANKLETLTLQNGGSIPLLLEILERNNKLGPKFFKNIDSLETPYDLNVLYSVLLNQTIDNQTKLKLVELLVIKYKADITNVPTFFGKNTSISIFQIIMLIINEIKLTNAQIISSILEIFSTNLEFKKMLETSRINLSQFLTANNKINKNKIIKSFEVQVALLEKEKQTLIKELENFVKNFQAKLVQSALINSQINSISAAKLVNNFSKNKGSAQLSQQLTSLPANPGSAQLSQQLSSLPANQGFAQIAQQSSSLPANQGFAQPQPSATSGKNSFSNKLKFWKNKEEAASQMNSSTNSTQNPNKSFFNRFKFGKKENKGQASLLPSSSPNSLQSSELPQTNQQEKKGIFSGLGNKARKFFGKNKGQASAESTPLLSSPPISLQNSASLNKQTSAIQIPELLQPVPQSGNPQNSTTTPIRNNPQNSTQLVTSSQNSTIIPTNQKQVGGKKIQMRTYHFLKNKKYSERAFIAERPIIAADNAYDFMKLHYDIGSKKITFTIHDRVNNKKYKYTARTLKDGTNVIKSAK